MRHYHNSTSFSNDIHSKYDNYKLAIINVRKHDFEHTVHYYICRNPNYEQLENQQK